ncbi:hypothetical protein [Halochromatium roseum]|uniref:hypothetical protein n=1 Tax=Halochromatium roseum TaxID=391920 RepID=UPI001914A9DD|nr:hypothetical protein [Halochromatium roseum]MBK5941828.1 hypothetical protein [Halochromatium roseum]
MAHPAAARLHERVSLLFGAVLERRQQGFTEGVSYDGYLLSFLADWLTTQPPQAREKLSAHPAWAGLLAQPLALAAPGDLMASAPLGDVEPVRMPFVWSALAKLHALQPTATTAWALARCALPALRADALVALTRAAETVSPQPPSGDAPIQLNATLGLRGGHAPEDLAWRAVWLIGRKQLLVCDQVQGATPVPVADHWHGHPELYWWIQQGAALLASAEQPERLLRISSPQCPLEPADLDRLPGSRGPLTLSVSLSPAPGEPILRTPASAPLQVTAKRGGAIMRAQARPDNERMRAIAVSCEESATLEF